MRQAALAQRSRKHSSIARMIPGPDISAIIAGTQPVAMQASRHKRDRVGDTREIGKRDLSEHAIIYLFVNGVAEGSGPGQRREAALAAWGIGETDARSCWG